MIILVLLIAPSAVLLKAGDYVGDKDAVSTQGWNLDKKIFCVESKQQGEIRSISVLQARELCVLILHPDQRPEMTVFSRDMAPDTRHLGAFRQQQ